MDETSESSPKHDPLPQSGTSQPSPSWIVDRFGSLQQHKTKTDESMRRNSARKGREGEQGGELELEGGNVLTLRLRRDHKQFSSRMPNWSSRDDLPKTITTAQPKQTRVKVSSQLGPPSPPRPSPFVFVSFEYTHSGSPLFTNPSKILSTLGSSHFESSSS